MNCPFCGVDNTQVRDSRAAEEGSVIRRRRFCESCQGRFTTYERIQFRDLIVIKENQKKEPFNREKLYRSIKVALKKRPVQDENIEKIVSKITYALEKRGESEINSHLIGNFVMDALYDIDHVAYVRFASVYRKFKEVQDFNDFIGKIKDDK